MEIAYKFTPKEINKLSKFKNPSIVLKKDNIIKNGKYKIYLTKNMFNRLLEKNELKYTFTDKRKEYYVQNGGNLGNIFKLFYHMQLILEKNYYQLLLLQELQQQVLI